MYGRIDVGRFPQPQLIVQWPVRVVQQQVRPAPIYQRVPPGHRQNWRKHCLAYGACGTPVCLVQERWYQDHVACPLPRRGEPDNRRDDRRGHPQDHGKATAAGTIGAGRWVTPAPAAAGQNRQHVFRHHTPTRPVPGRPVPSA